MGDKKEQYSKTRNDFERLDLEDRAVFLVEAAFSTAAEALERAGRGVAGWMDKQKQKKRKDKSTESPKEGTAANGAETWSEEAGRETPSGE